MGMGEKEAALVGTQMKNLLSTPQNDLSLCVCGFYDCISSKVLLLVRMHEFHLCHSLAL